MNHRDKLLINTLTVPVPSNEEQRLCVLRETKLLDTDLNDPAYDRYTSMVKRIFGVPIALISIVDIDRQWFKSNVGLDVNQTHRNLAFCTYTILPNTKDVMVVLDTYKDYRFKDSALVLGPPYIRFYAGAALIIEGVKIGSLCAIDTKPWDNFDLDKQMTLLDLGHAVSLQIARHRKKALNIKNVRAASVLELMQDFRLPLQGMSKSLGVIQSFMNNTSHNISIEFRETISEVSVQLRKIGTAIERNLLLAPIILRKKDVDEDDTSNKSDEINKLTIKEICDVMSIVEQAKDIMSSVTCGNTIEWLVDPTYLSLGKQVSDRDVLLYVIISAINNIINDWAHISVFIGFRKAITIEKKDTIYNSEENELFTILAGKLSVELRASGKLISSHHNHDVNKDNMNGTSMTTNTTKSITLLNEYYSLENVLSDIGGGIRFTDLSEIPQSKQVYISDVEYEYNYDKDYQNSHISTRKFDNHSDSKYSLDLLIDNSNDDQSQKIYSYEYYIPCQIYISKDSEHLHSNRLEVLLICKNITDHVSILLSNWLHQEGTIVISTDNSDRGLELLLSRRFDVCFLEVNQVHSSGALLRQVYQNKLSMIQHNRNISLKSTILFGISLHESPSKTTINEAFGHGIHYFVLDPLSEHGKDTTRWILNKLMNISNANFKTTLENTLRVINNHIKSLAFDSSFLWIDDIE